MKNAKKTENIKDKIRDNEMEVSSSLMESLMQKWVPSNFKKRTTGSYSDGVLAEREMVGNKPFNKMSREELIDFIFDGADEMGEALNDYSDSELTEIAVEKNKKITESKNPLGNYNSLGIKTAIKKLEKGSIYDHNSFKILLNRYKNLVENSNIPESFIIENFISELSNYSWDELVESERNILLSVRDSKKAEILVENTIYLIRRDSGWKFYKEPIDVMNEWLTKDKKSMGLLAKDIRKWSFNPMVNNLVNRLNEMESNGKNSLSIPVMQAESYVDKIYSPVLVEKKNIYFCINDKFFVGDDEKLSTISENLIDPKFREINSVLRRNKNNIKIEEGITYYINKDRINIINENRSINIYLNGNKLKYQNDKGILVKLLESHFNFHSNFLKDFMILYENFDNIVELDFAKSIKSKLYEGLEVNIIKWKDKIYLNSVNPSMNENSVYVSNGRHAVKYIKEKLKYDISEGLVEYLDGDDKIKAVMFNDRDKILKNIELVEGEIKKIDNIINGNNPRLANSPEIKAARKMLENEISKLQNKWSSVNTEINKFETINFKEVDNIFEGDSDLTTGTLVKVMETGNTGKIISIDTTTGTYTVLLDNGKTGEYNSEEIENIQTSLMKVSDRENIEDEDSDEEDKL